MFLFSVACQNNTKQEEVGQEKDAEQLSPREVLYNEVMQVHDEVMPRMSDIMSLSKRLKAVAATEGTDAEKASELRTNLEVAGESMMNWMRNFNPDFENQTSEEAMDYLKIEKERISAVKEGMETAIDQAESFLQSNLE